jgi:N-acetylmuramoyl-L-alanine amidase
MVSKSPLLRVVLVFGILSALGLAGPEVLRAQSQPLSDSTSSALSAVPKVSEFSLAERSDNQGYVVRAHVTDSSLVEISYSREDSTVVWVLPGVTLAKDWQGPTLKGPVSGFRASDTSSQVTARLTLDLFRPARVQTYPDRISNDLLLNLEYRSPDLSEISAPTAEASTTGTTASTLPPESLPDSTEISYEFPLPERPHGELSDSKNGGSSPDSARCCSPGKDGLSLPSLPKQLFAFLDSFFSADQPVGSSPTSSSGGSSPGGSAAPPRATIGFPPPPGSPLKRIMNPTAVDTIIIDPGHGGFDPGAAAHGLLEKDIVLSVAQRAAELIERHLRAEVLLTRTTDQFLTLDERARFANAKGGDLFISVHTNASPAAHLKGTEVYVLGSSGSKKAARAMRRENVSVQEFLDLGETGPAKSPSARTFFSGNGASPMKRVLSGRPRSRIAFINERSRRFARILQHRIRRRISANDPIRQATFEVLWRARMPAVLLELGYLTNPEEAQYLSEPSAQKYLAWQIYRSVKARGKKIDDPTIDAPTLADSGVDDPFVSGVR